MVEIAPGWELNVERESDWLLVRLKSLGRDAPDATSLAEALWELLNQHLTYRLVLELDQIEVLYSCLIGQIVLLHKRLHVHGGAMRLCGLSPHNQQVLRFARLDDRFPPYRSREDAISGRHRPGQPR